MLLQPCAEACPFPTDSPTDRAEISKAFSGIGKHWSRQLGKAGKRSPKRRGNEWSCSPLFSERAKKRPELYNNLLVGSLGL